MFRGGGNGAVEENGRLMVLVGDASGCREATVSARAWVAIRSRRVLVAHALICAPVLAQQLTSALGSDFPHHLAAREGRVLRPPPARGHFLVQPGSSRRLPLLRAVSALSTNLGANHWKQRTARSRG